MEQKMTQRQQQAARTKEKIQREATRLFREKGLAETKISDICRAAGVSNGNFYHYFQSKDYLYLSMYASFDDFVEQDLSKRQFASNLEAIRALIFLQVYSGGNTSPAIQAQMFQAQLNTRGGYVVEEDRFIHTYMKELLRRGIEVGEIHPSHDVDRTAKLIFQVSRGILFDWSMRGGNFSREEQIELALDLLLSALQMPKPAETPVDRGDYARWQKEYFKEYFKEKGWVQ